MLAFSVDFRKIPMKLFSFFFPFDEVVLQSKKRYEMLVWFANYEEQIQKPGANHC